MTSDPVQAPVLLLASLALAVPSLSAQSILSQHGEIVIAVGDNAPGVPGAQINSAANFDNPVMDQNGTVLVRARLINGGVSALDDRAYFMGRTDADLQLVVRAGDPAPGFGPGIFLRSDTSGVGLVGNPRISAFGEFLFFQSQISDDGGAAVTAANDTVYFWGPYLSLTPLAREGDTVPFVAVNPPAYGNLTWPQIIAMSPQSRVLFATQLVGGDVTIGSNDYALVTGTPGTLEIVSRNGDVLGGGEVVIPVSGTSTLSFVGQINIGGQVLHDLRFQNGPGGVTVNDDRALAVWTPGIGDTIIAREGQQAPGLPVGVQFLDNGASAGLWSPGVSGNSFNALGKTVFNTKLDGGGTVIGTDEFACYYGGIGGLSLVFRRGDAAPGLPGVLMGVANNASLMCNDAEQISFFASLEGTATATNDSSIWLGTVGNLALIAREGDNVPGLAPSGNGPWKYGQLNANPMLNGRGNLLFQNQITDGVVFRSVVFAYDAAHGVRLALDDTDTFTTVNGTGPWTSFGNQGVASSGDAGPTWFNNNGDFVFKPGFASPLTAAIMRGHVGSFVATPSAVTAAGGTAQQFFIDGGPANGNSFYFVLATALGTRPGFPSPIGPQQIPLNFDGLWTQLSISAVNSPLWVNTLGITDANGVGIGISGFVMPTGFPGFNGVTVHHAALFFDLSITSTFVTEPSALLLY